MDRDNKAWFGLRRVTDKIKDFFGKTLHSKSDSTLGSNAKDDAYKRSHEKMKMY